MKNLIVVISLFAFCNQFYSQKKELNGIYQVVIFEHGTSKTLKIDENGNTNLGFKIDLTKMNKKIEAHLADNEYSLNEANDDPPREARYPEKGKKMAYIKITLKKDFYDDNNFITKTNYTKDYLQKELNFIEYDILDLLIRKDYKKIKNVFIN